MIHNHNTILGMENNTTHVEMAPQTESPKQARISLNEPTERKHAARIPVPSVFDSVKAFGRTALSRVEPLKVKAQQVLREAHATSGRDLVADAFDKAERVSGEIAGATGALVRSTTAIAVGSATGLLIGLRGVSVSALKRMRMDVENFTELGSWNLAEEGDALALDLHTDPMDPTKAADTAYEVSLSTGKRTRFEMDDEQINCVVFPIDEKGTHQQIGFLICAEDADNSVYLWIDA